MRRPLLRRVKSAETRADGVPRATGQKQKQKQLLQQPTPLTYSDVRPDRSHLGWYYENLSY